MRKRIWIDDLLRKVRAGEEIPEPLVVLDENGEGDPRVVVFSERRPGEVGGHDYCFRAREVYQYTRMVPPEEFAESRTPGIDLEKEIQLVRMKLRDAENLKGERA